ncbi:NOB1 family endonuclease [Candidatus Bathyarchaeota archaeon]|nr:NOB1 family endonuclease [Candidatus Bathyarchaeota archaeon]
MTTYILDTSALVMGVNPSAIKGRVYSVPEVERELPPKSMAAIRFTTSRESRSLSIRAPQRASYEAVRRASLKLGEKGALSRADLQILALGLDLRMDGLNPTIVSDDYAVQNVAEHLGLSYTSLATFGITYEFNWSLYCPACFRRYLHSYLERRCEVCGTALKRRVLKRCRKADDLEGSSGSAL